MYNESISKAIEILNAGGVIVFPTDTAFGVGCRIDCFDAVDRIFRIRERPTTQALPVLVSGQQQALTYFRSPSDVVRRLMDQYWPGALTIVDYCHKNLVYSPIRGGGETIGLREPNHEVLKAIFKGVDVPIVGPSANIHGKDTPYTFDALDLEFIKRVDFVIPGKCQVGISSTVVDCTTTPYTIIRQGAIRL